MTSQAKGDGDDCHWEEKTHGTPGWVEHLTTSSFVTSSVKRRWFRGEQLESLLRLFRRFQKYLEDLGAG